MRNTPLKLHRESIDLTLFNVGLISNPDQQDIPNEAQAEGSYNLDVETSGRLKGIPDNSVYKSSPTGDGGNIADFIQKDDDTWDLIYSDGSAIYHLANFYGSGVLSSIATAGATSMVRKNRELHIGCGTDNPKWAGYISWGQFGGSTPTSLVVEDALLRRPNFGTGTTNTIRAGTATQNTGTAGHEANALYRYRISFIYDGYQESPLSSGYKEVQVGASDLESIELPLSYNSSTASIPLSKRVTGINIYRSSKRYKAISYFDNTGLVTEVLNETEWDSYKLVASTDIVGNVDWTGTSTKEVTITDENNLGVTYEINSGIEASINEIASSPLIPNDYEINYTAITSLMKYKLSTSLNDYLFVANCIHPELPDEEASATIFRSKKSRYDVFDWLNDRVILPSIPTAIASHRDKLYVWDLNNTYIINPESLVIEKKIVGRGCASQQSLVETDYGLFWANKNGVYVSTQTVELLQPTKDNLSEPIKAQYQEAASSVTPLVTFNSPRNQLLIHLGTDVFAYNTVEHRWDLYDSFNNCTGTIIGKDGETYSMTSSSGIYKDFGNTSTKSWIFYSKEFILDDPSQDKKFYKIPRDSSGVVTISYSLDGGSTWNVQDDSDFIDRAKSISLKIAGTGQGALLDSISIIYRRLRGKR